MTTLHGYRLDRKRGFIYRRGCGAAVAQIIPQADRGEDSEFKTFKLFVEREIIAAQSLHDELDAIKHAAHMPSDYEHGLASWINQVLYANYIGASISPHITELVESGRLTFPNSPSEQANSKLREACKAGSDPEATL